MALFRMELSRHNVAMLNCGNKLITIFCSGQNILWIVSDHMKRVNEIELRVGRTCP